MAVWSAVRVSDLYGAFRLDAECYTPRMLRDHAALASLSAVKLGDIAFVTDGQHGYHEVDENSPVRHLTAKSVGPGVVIDKGADRLALATHCANPASILEENDLLLSTAGTIGETGVVTSEVLPANIDQDVARIHVAQDSPIHPYFLCAFLRSEYGLFQCVRGTTGQIQGHINLATLRNFDIPLLPGQDAVVRIMRDGIARYHHSSECINVAEELLTEALGLHGLDLAPAKCYSRPYSDLEYEGRFDAEFFSPRYQAVIRNLRAGGLSLADVAPLAERPFNPSQMRGHDQFSYIEIGSLTDDGQAEADSVLVSDAPSRARWKVEPGDVITSTVRPIRRLSALIREDQSGFVCSSGFAVLSPRVGPDGIEPEVLLTYLRLPIICEVLDLHTTASMYPAIPINRLMSIPIVKPAEDIRKSVVAAVRDAVASRREGLDLLEQARRMVEDLVAQYDCKAGF